MKVALVGATGNAGSRILNELLERGHMVTAIVRRPDRVPIHPWIVAIGTDGSEDALAAAIKGNDAVVSSVRFVDLAPEVLVAAVKKSGVKRYVVVGGAGSLLHPDGIEEARRPDFPEAFRANSLRGGDLLTLLRQTPELEWTFISPPRIFRPGERTGKFRYGKDHMLMTDDGMPTSISFEDFALGLANELENPRHARERFTIGY
ncbi:NAD(P)H-binding protein [Agrobacterium rhizogenes]|uniref:NAD(P)-dependent oxidoreductase n=1 Tax=Rhizobium rhizogenes TaxID=359 RepID=UPI001571A490|nr:NAD(P)H-binding protein [Rhizobium rhizogenes]NTF53011.1 NAD(P)H-binding protein [Rhizobium rhizogenes]NTF65948.1 NAD(P)H-binding protein [Rhizobium rhizogenes]NTG05170.1 NAD(P)H-binding protein [Rhizobium rhizogenes]NTG18464.1 NAD(P)H-binding protein [Rhizobium rhizogenes]NTG25268.1 NAD(P)H-binding protein [Rhizobium rhizogenes]